MKPRMIAIAAVAVLISACATVPPSTRDDRVADVIGLLADAPIPSVVEQASLPFLFTDQVVSSESDLTAVLTRFRSAAVTIDPVPGASTPAPGAPSGSRFDVAVFYDRLPDDARFVRVETGAGPLTIIVGGSRNRRPLLMGILRGAQ